MTRASDQDRKRAAKDWRLLSTEDGKTQCDCCEAQAVSGSTNGESVAFHCAAHFMTFVAEQRAKRPSRQEMVARVNAAIR